ncbi:hypothetical protein BKG69_06080 [Mycobacteroides chelonae]|nr:hypothetical protein BKG69_06080 [Mycobacteroides chelonae]
MAFKIWIKDEDTDAVRGPIGYTDQETYVLRDGGVLELITEDQDVTLYAADRWVRLEATDHPQRG